MKPIASLSLDLDNEWAYLKTHGDPAWEAMPSYLDCVIPRVLDMLARRGLRITFFVVGLDAAQEKNRSALAQLASAGHEIGNHSLRHEPWLHLYSEEELERDLSEAEAHIEAAQCDPEHVDHVAVFARRHTWRQASSGGGCAVLD